MEPSKVVFPSLGKHLLSQIQFCTVLGDVVKINPVFFQHLQSIDMEATMNMCFMLRDVLLRSHEWRQRYWEEDENEERGLGILIAEWEREIEREMVLKRVKFWES